MNRPTTMRRLRLLVLCITITMQTWAHAQEAEELTSVRGTMVVPDDEPTATEVALMLRAHPDPSETEPSGSLIELRTGVFVGSSAPVDDDGRFVLALPAAHTLPSELIGPAQGAVSNTRDFDRCELVASDPLARTTVTGFAFVTGPAIALTTDVGTVVGIATDVPFDVIAGDVDMGDVAFQVWIYADRDVRLTTPSDGCSDDAVTLHVDVRLLGGWNQLEWRAAVDPETQRVRLLTLSDGGAAEVFVVGVYEL